MYVCICKNLVVELSHSFSGSVRNKNISLAYNVLPMFISEFVVLTVMAPARGSIAKLSKSGKRGTLAEFELVEYCTEP